MSMMLRLISLLCFVGCMVIQVEITGHTLCPDNWTPFQGSCYLFGYDQRMAYTGAEHYCVQHGPYLVNVGDVHERNFLVNKLTHSLPHPWWIGLNDRDIEAEYTWIDTNTAPNYTDWIGGSPKQGVSTTHNSDCVSLQPPTYEWLDTDCVAPFQPICEKQGLNGEGAVG